MQHSSSSAIISTAASLRYWIRFWRSCHHDQQQQHQVLLSADKTRIIATRFGLAFYFCTNSNTRSDSFDWIIFFLGYVGLRDFIFFHFSGRKSSQKFLFFLPRDSRCFRGFHLLTLTWFSISHWFRGASCTSKAPNDSQISSIFFRDQI